MSPWNVQWCRCTSCVSSDDHIWETKPFYPLSLNSELFVLIGTKSVIEDFIIWQLGSCIVRCRYITWQFVEFASFDSLIYGVLRQKTTLWSLKTPYWRAAEVPIPRASNVNRHPTAHGPQAFSPLSKRSYGGRVYLDLPSKVIQEVNTLIAHTELLPGQCSTKVSSFVVLYKTSFLNGDTKEGPCSQQALVKW